MWVGGTQPTSRPLIEGILPMGLIPPGCHDQHLQGSIPLARAAEFAGQRPGRTVARPDRPPGGHRPTGGSTAHRLADGLGGYSVHVCPKTGRGRKQEGIAALSRLPVEGHEVLDLRSQQRVAQFVTVRVKGRPLVLVNGHYYWPVGAHSARVRQVGRVLERVKALEPGTSVIACGDFNATPGSRAVALMSRTFDSAHLVRNGREPDFTCPTPLISGGRVRRGSDPRSVAAPLDPTRRPLAWQPGLHLRQHRRPARRV